VGTYWGTVVIMAIRKRVNEGQRSGLIPRQRYERRLWLLIVPSIGLSLLLPLLGSLTRSPWLTPGAWATEMPMLAVRWTAVSIAILCYLVSLYSWSSLGRSWSLGVVPDQKTELVTGGIYGWVRHPIYALNMAMMLMVAVTTATIPMALVAGVYLVAMNLKAANEERHLTQTFGVSYTEYCQRVGRFFPHLTGERRASA
jgi:protein-S-isoprenylcysteine O-methyltransferase Ste14